MNQEGSAEKKAGDFWMKMDDGASLFIRRWKADNPRAAVHLIHGMAEHSGRYLYLMRRLGENGIETWAADQRGHGKTAAEGKNRENSGGQFGHCADGDGFYRVSCDIDAVCREIMNEHPGLPVFLLGHSWGSFIAQNYIEKFEGPAGLSRGRVILAGCILSGTKGPGGLKAVLGSYAAQAIALLKGERNGSLMIKTALDSAFNKPFRPGRTDSDWLSRDENMVDAYINDPLCGFLCSTGFYRDMAKALSNIHRKREMGKIRKNLPVYIFSGSADPVGDMGESHAALAVAYRHLGIEDLETVLYPDARHETLNETNREEVIASLISWLLRHL